MLREPRVLNSFVFDEHCFHGTDKYPTRILPSIYDLTLVTASEFPHFGIELETMNHSTVDLKQERIRTFLKHIGVKRLRFAGECVWKWAWFTETKRVIEYQCLTTVAEVFQKDFEISGIKGCLYPSKPIFASKLLKKLYQDYPRPNEPPLKIWIKPSI